MSKKILIILSLIFLLTITFSVVGVAKDDIKLVVNGKVVTDDLDYQIINSSILVPVHVLTDNLGVKMRWFSSIQTLQLTSEYEKIKLRIGDRNLQVNNRLLKMPVGAKLIDGQPMVPLKPLGEALSLVIKADPKNKVVSISEIRAQLLAVNYKNTDEYEGVEIKTTDKVECKVNSLHNPYRLVVDLKGVGIYKELKNLNVDSKLIKSVRIAQFNSSTARIVLDLFANVDYKLKERAGDNYSFLLKISPIITDLDYNNSVINLTATAPLISTSVKYLSNPKRAVIDINNAALNNKQELNIDDKLIKRVRMSQYQTNPNNIVRVVLDLTDDIVVNTIKDGNSLLIKPITSKLLSVDYNDKERKLGIELKGQVKPDAMFLKSGNRLVLDFPSTVNDFDKERIKFTNDIIEEIRISQFTRDKTRVVVDFDKYAPYRLDWEGDTLVVKFMNRLLGVNVVDKELGAKLNLSLLAPGDYKVHKLFNPNRLVVDLMNTIVNKDEVKLVKKSDMVKEVRISQYSNYPQQARVVLEFEDSFAYKSPVKDRSKNIDIEVNKFNLNNRVIVIDPGHGGHDPGALGFSEAREKDLVLDIGLRLERLLVATGAKVIMTRKTDNFVELDDRAKLANNLDADIFVSIHANAHKKDNHMGTETYVSPSSSDYALFLARFVQNSLLKELDTCDRGVKENNLYVLEHTKMPAILAEVAFVSNPDEEKLLLKDDFRENSAKALYEGISKYFELLSEEEF